MHCKVKLHYMRDGPIWALLLGQLQISLSHSLLWRKSMVLFIYLFIWLVGRRI